MTEQPPTAEADPQSLGQLFAADPEELTNENIDTIVSHFREKRKLFLQQEKTKPSGGGKAKKDAPDNLSLEDLLK